MSDNRKAKIMGLSGVGRVSLRLDNRGSTVQQNMTSQQNVRIFCVLGVSYISFYHLGHMHM